MIFNHKHLNYLLRIILFVVLFINLLIFLELSLKVSKIEIYHHTLITGLAYWVDISWVLYLEDHSWFRLTLLFLWRVSIIWEWKNCHQIPIVSTHRSYVCGSRCGRRQKLMTFAVCHFLVIQAISHEKIIDKPTFVVYKWE